jgi:hypothetical protein
MNDRKDPPKPYRRRRTDRVEATSWEARALAQVRPRLRELTGPEATESGWETDTISRLEDYFDRREV